MKSYQLGTIYEYAGKHPLTDDNILHYYHQWDMYFDRHGTDLNEFMTLCCMLKCITQLDDDKIILHISHIYSITRYQSCLAALEIFRELAHSKQYYQNKPLEQVTEEMLNLYGEIFGIRFRWAINALVGDLGNIGDYYIDLSSG